MNGESNLRNTIRDAQQGCAEAIEALVMQFAGVVQQECARYAANLPPDLSQADLVQEVLLRVLTKLHQFHSLSDEQPTQAAFASWIRVSARSTLNNLHRARNTQQRAPRQALTAFDETALQYQQHLPCPSGPSSILAREEEAERLRDTMQRRLDERTLEILNRHIVDGQSFKEICDAMSLSYDQVRYAFHTAQTQLKDWLA